jgi:hypothetical protein
VGDSDRAQELEDSAAKKMAKRAQVFLERREAGVRPSHTLIFEAALFLAHNLGLTPTQIIAFLHFAVWVQSVKVAEWIAKDKLQGKNDEVETFLLLVLGAGGCGKSTFILVAAVFARHWLGPDVVRKVAIANSAARQIGGDTMHALLKLPMSYMGEINSHSKGQTLQVFRKRFREVKTLFIDECSMVSRS